MGDLHRIGRERLSQHAHGLLLWAAGTIADLYVLEGDLEGERLVVVRVEGAFLYGRLLLAEALPVLHQRDLHVRI